MTQRRKNRPLLGRISALVLAGLFAFNCLGNIAQVHAEDKSTAPVTIGVLDEGKLSDSYTKYQDAMKVIDQHAQDLDEQLKARDLFNADEGARFDTLMVKQDRTPAEQTELDALLKTGNDRRAELLALSGKATRTDAENARINELQTTLKSNSDAVQKLQDALLKSLLDQKHATEKTFTDLANSTVADVAKERHLTIVLSKSAVVWNDNTVDITDIVIKRLNK